MRFRLFLAAIAAVLVFNVNAKTLQVREYGVGNSFASLQAALNSTSTGDTVLVYNRAGGKRWGPAFIQRNVYLTTASDTEKLLIESINFVADSTTELYFDNLNFTTMSYTSGNATAARPANIVVNNCKYTGALALNTESIITEIFYSDLGSGCTISRGKIIGNTLGQMGVNTTLGITQSTTDNYRDTIFVVGNYGNVTQDASSSGTSIYISKPAIISNNYFNLGSATSNFFNIRIRYRNDSITDYYQISNNTFANMYYSYLVAVVADYSNGGIGIRKDNSMWLVNNIFHVITSNTNFSGTSNFMTSYSSFVVIQNNLLTGATWLSSLSSQNYFKSSSAFPLEVMKLSIEKGPP